MPPRSGGYDPWDYHDPTRGIGGAPPARSALRLRGALAVMGLVLCAGAMVIFVVVDVPVVFTVAAGVLAAVSAVDLVVVIRRLRIERR
jgi:hypothetical protein